MNNVYPNEAAPNSELVDYYAVFGPSRFGPVGRRSLQIKARRFRLPIIYTGRSALIDPVAGDDRLREFAAHQEPQRRRGRPRAGA